MSLNFELTQDQRAIIDTVRELTRDKFKPNALKYLDGTFPWDNMRDLAKIGVLGMAVPEEYGGLGPAGAGHGAGARRDRERLLRHGDGRDRRSRRAVQDSRQLRA